MLAVDSNILVYAHRPEFENNDEAYEFITGLAHGDQPWAIPWPCCHEFLSVVTNRKIWKEAASTPQEAWHQMRVWRRHRCVA